MWCKKQIRLFAQSPTFRTLHLSPLLILMFIHLFPPLALDAVQADKRVAHRLLIMHAHPMLRVSESKIREHSGPIAGSLDTVHDLRTGEHARDVGVGLGFALLRGDVDS